MSKVDRFHCHECDHYFNSKVTFDNHMKKHVKKHKSIELLKQGFQPQYTKIGTKFKGKNDVVIS